MQVLRRGTRGENQMQSENHMHVPSSGQIIELLAKTQADINFGPQVLPPYQLSSTSSFSN